MAHWRKLLPADRFWKCNMKMWWTIWKPKSRRMIEFLGLEWNEACLAFHKTARQIHTASFNQVREPIYRSSVGRWKRYAKPFAAAARQSGRWGRMSARGRSGCRDPACAGGNPAGKSRSDRKECFGRWKRPASHLVVALNRFAPARPPSRRPGDIGKVGGSRAAESGFAVRFVGNAIAAGRFRARLARIPLPLQPAAHHAARSQGAKAPLGRRRDTGKDTPYI